MTPAREAVYLPMLFLTVGFLGGVRVAYEVFGQGDQTLLLLPPWAIVHSRFWKLQVPYLARHFRVVTFDARGNGRSDRPATAADTSQTKPSPAWAASSRIKIAM